MSHKEGKFYGTELTLTPVLISMERFPYVLKMLIDSPYKAHLLTEKEHQRALELFFGLE